MLTVARLLHGIGTVACQRSRESEILDEETLDLFSTGPFEKNVSQVFPIQPMSMLSRDLRSLKV